MPDKVERLRRANEGREARRYKRLAGETRRRSNLHNIMHAADARVNIGTSGTRTQTEDRCGTQLEIKVILRRFLMHFTRVMNIAQNYYHIFFCCALLSRPKKKKCHFCECGG